jgi:hypothetical protein
MTGNQTVPPAGIAAALRELIEAVDRRAPQLEWACEPRVAKVAAALRVEAARRLETLVGVEVDDDRRLDGDLVDAVMTDDGGPAPADLPARGALG